MSIALAHELQAAPISRDHDALLTDLMLELEGPLYSFIVSVVHDRDVALDCLQDTFLRAYDALRAGKSINAAWLFTVARNRSIDEFRRNRRLQHDSAALERVPVRDSRDESLVVQAVLDRLPPLDRQVLYLFVVAGFKTDEIGDIMGMTGAAIRQRLYRARERFRTLYGPPD